MKRFACHHLYVSSDACFSKGVVELGDDGKVCGYFCLEEEISATQWIGGVIILSSAVNADKKDGESFRLFLERIVKKAEDVDCYAWHIADFDLIKEEFNLRSKLVRL